MFCVQESPALEGYRNKCEFTIGFHPDTLKLTVGFRLGQPFLVSRRVSDPDPDPYWIQNQSGQWIRFRIQEGKNDAQKLEKVKIFHGLK
jgi:hypothetical protein